jgi:diguanylate cyclase (GGDEF)-like protein
MYFSEFKIIIFGENREAAESIADRLRVNSLPEDCEYNLECAAYGEECEIPVTDSAVIIDANADALRGYKRMGEERVVFLTSGCAMAELDTETLSLADDLWILPGKLVHDERLLSVYFTQLIKAMKERSDARKLKICFETAIDSIPDLVWFKDAVGAHLIVNNGFCKATEKTKEQIYKRGHYYIWDIPKEEYEQGEYVCLESEDIVIEARKTCLFDEKVKTKRGMRQFKTYKSPLIDSNGKVFGTCGIAHDVTDLSNISNELNIMLESIPFGIVIEDSLGKIITSNSFLLKYFPDARSSIGTDFEEWKDKLEGGTNVRQVHDEDEFGVMVKDKERIMRFRKEPIIDIFGEQIGGIAFFRDVTLQYEFEQQAIQCANTDFLTGLNNRRSLFNYLKSLDKGTPLTLITIDLDHFKKVNDSYGHHVGDEALVASVEVMNECFPDDFIARLGGDEFLIALVGEYPLEEVEMKTQSLLDSMRERYDSREEFEVLTASAGIAQSEITGDVHKIDDLMMHSDKALYAAKETGRAKFCVYDSVNAE